MKSLYFKNFKGFKEELIDFKDVNFLVGENSTGKTSVLKLVKLVYNPGFIDYHNFNNEYVKFGYFDEIKNQLVKEDFFEIGFDVPRTDSFFHNSANSRDYKYHLKFCNNHGNPNLQIGKASYEEGLSNFIFLDQKEPMFSHLPKVTTSFEDWINLKETSKIEFGFPLDELGFEDLADFVQMESLESTGYDSSKFIRFEGFKSYKWLAPIRAKAKRNYESFNAVFSPEGDHIPLMIKSLLNGKSNETENKAIIRSLENFGKQSNLFDKIEIEEIGKNGTFSINILYNGFPVKLPNVGYGVSQALPLLIEILASKDTLISMQQPEVHLHPKAQAAFGDFVFDSFKKDKNQFLIETHSEYMIDRFRYALSKSRSKTKNPTAQILYFERNKNGNKITAIPINSDGTYEKALPKSYQNFFLNEEMKTLQI